MSLWSQFILFGGSILPHSPTASRCTPARPPQRRRRTRAPGVTGQVRECRSARRQNAPQMLTLCPTNFSCRELNFGCAESVCNCSARVQAPCVKRTQCYIGAISNARCAAYFYYLDRERSRNAAAAAGGRVLSQTLICSWLELPPPPPPTA